jgi:hypothetical protein
VKQHGSCGNALGAQYSPQQETHGIAEQVLTLASWSAKYVVKPLRSCQLIHRMASITALTAVTPAWKNFGIKHDTNIKADSYPIIRPKSNGAGFDE